MINFTVENRDGRQAPLSIPEGISLNLMVGMIMVAVGLAGWALVAQDSLTSMFQAMGKVLGG